jgi:D-alanyl-D-alanine carboxypeptidase
MKIAHEKCIPRVTKIMTMLLALEAVEAGKNPMTTL